MTTKLRKELEKREVLVTVGCYDALTARIAEELGFRAITMQGFLTGAHLCTTEPLTTMTEFVWAAKYLTDAVNIPVIVDAGAGFGGPAHVMRTVKQFESVNVAGIHIEDQQYPKRLQYHLGTKRVIPIAQMVAKLKAALDARKDGDFIIIARTDALEAENGGFHEALERVKTYADLGVDLIMPQVRNKEDMRTFAESVSIPLWCSPRIYGTMRNRKVDITVQDCEKIGYQVLNYPLQSILIAAKAVKNLFKGIQDKGYIDAKPEEMQSLRRWVIDLIGVPKLVEREMKAEANNSFD